MTVWLLSYEGEKTTGNRVQLVYTVQCYRATKYGSKYSLSDLVDTPLAHCSWAVITAEYSRGRDVTIYNCKTIN